MIENSNIEFINLLDVDFELQKETRIWRNSKEVNEFFQLEHISEETHLNWLNSLNTKENAIAFLIFFNKNSIGLIYLRNIDNFDKSAELGIYIYDKNFRGKNIGFTAMNFIIEKAFYELKLEKLNLEVLDSNTAAINLYKKLNFIQKENNERIIIKNNNKIKVLSFVLNKEVFIKNANSI